MDSGIEGKSRDFEDRYLPWLRRLASAAGDLASQHINEVAEDGGRSAFEDISAEGQPIGHVDAEAGCRIRGWVVRPDNIGAPVSIDVLVNGELWWEGEARRFWTFDPEGVPFRLPVGFSVDLPSATPQCSRWSVEVRTTVDGAPLTPRPILVDAANRFEGFIDEILILGEDQCEVVGWVRDLAERLTPVDVEILSGDRRLATATANHFREDLWTAGKGHGKHGFRAAISAEGVNLESIFVAVAATHTPLSRHDRTRFAAAPAVLVPSSLRLDATVAGNVIGTVDRWSANEVLGWARSVLAPDQPIQLDLLIDNQIFASTFASIFREDLQLLFNDHGFHGFHFEILPTYRPLQPLNFRVSPRNIKGEISNAQHSMPTKVAGIVANTAADRIVVAKEVHRSLAHVAAPIRESGLPPCAFIVLNRDGAKLLEDFFISFRQHNSYANVEILIIDHGSVDDSENVCLRWSSQLKIKFIPRGRNFTFSESNNYGARLTNAEFLFFVNNDITFLQDMLWGAVEVLRDPNVAVLGVCLLDTPLGQSGFSPPLIQHLGVHYYTSPKDRSIHPIETRYLPHLHDVHHSPWRVPTVTGAFMVCRREDFEALGGFCEDYNYGYEDVDFCLGAILRLGKEIVSANHLGAYHLRGSSRKKSGVWLGETMLSNRRVLERRYGFPARRRQRAELLTRPGYWTSSAPRIAFAVTEASDTASAGDFFTAKGLAEELIKLVDAIIIYLEESDWYDLQGVDVLIVMRHDYNLANITNAGTHLLKVGWARNWIESWGTENAYDVMWAASAKAADYLRLHLSMPVKVVPIATGMEVFAPREAEESLVSDYCFTGSFWGLPRDIIYKLDPEALPFRFAIFGHGWDQVPNFAPYHRGPLPYSRMAAVYASTKIVIDDANSVTKQWGSVNSRVFDAIAAGALVITNGVEGSQTLFDGLLPTYSTRQELETLLWRYLQDEVERQTLVEKLRHKVLASHTYVLRARQSFESLTATGLSQLHIAIKIGAPNENVCKEWGDYHFALALKRAFSRKGHTVRIDCLNSWYGPSTHGDDVVLVLRGLTRYIPKAGQINLVWVISHPNELSVGEFQSYDHVFVASESYAPQLAAQIAIPITPLLQCTDPELFHDAVGQPNAAADVLFVGNSRNVFRGIVKECYINGIEMSVYGKGWKGWLPDHYIKGEHIQNKELAVHYRHAGVVLNDHWDDMREKGFVSNRVFDSVASGARVISDSVPGMRELFGDLVTTYSSRTELPGLIKTLQTEPETRRVERAALAARIRQAHSFDVRAAKIMNVIETLDNTKGIVTSPLGLPSVTFSRNHR